MLRWEIREGLIRYVNILREEAKEMYKLQLLAYYTGGLKKKPKVPKILGGEE